MFSLIFVVGPTVIVIPVITEISLVSTRLTSSGAPVRSGTSPNPSGTPEGRSFRS